MYNDHAEARCTLVALPERSPRWSESSAFLLAIAVPLLCLPKMLTALGTASTVEFHLGEVSQQSVGRPVDIGPPQTVGGVSALDVAMVDASWGDRDVEFTLRNQAGQAVTAWAVQVDVLHPDGFTARFGASREGYAEYEGLNRGTAPPVVIPAGGEIRTRVRLQTFRGHPEPVLPPIVTVVGVVYIDVSTAGDPFSLRQIFAGREQYYDGWAAVVAALESADSKTAVRDRVATALAAMEKTETERFSKGTGLVDSTARARLIVATAREHLRRAIDGTAKVVPEEAVRNYVLEARRELMAIEHHRRPER